MLENDSLKNKGYHALCSFFLRWNILLWHRYSGRPIQKRFHVNINERRADIDKI